MGSSGGHTKKTHVTGKQKKILRQLSKEFGEQKGNRKLAQDTFAKLLTSPHAQRHIKNFMAKSGDDPYKDIRELFGAGKGFQKADYAKDIRQGYDLTRPIFEGEKQSALRNFEQQTAPQLFGAYGVGSRGGSALNQALAASRTQLESELFNRSNALGLEAGQQIAGMNQQERGRQQALQYGALSDILNTQRSAASEYYGLKQSAANQLSSAGLPGAQSALAKDSYTFAPRGTPFAQTVVQSLIEGGAKVAGAAAGKA